MRNAPILLAVATMCAWGFWAIFAKLATDNLIPETAMIISYVVGALIASVYVVVQGKSTHVVYDGVFYAVLAGIASAFGAITLYAALGKGNAAIVTSISALYFVVAAVIGILFLGESLRLTDVVGILLA
jgi:uncharacterized membrane protein